MSDVKILQLAPPERNIYLANLKDDTGIAYNVVLVYEINGKIDIDKFSFVWSKVIERHENLRKSYRMIDESIVAIVNNNVDSKIEFQIAPEEKIKEIVIGWTKPIDVSKAPLIFPKLVKCSDEKYLFIINAHHIIFDGASAQILMNELCSLYSGENKSEGVQSTFSLLEKFNAARKDKEKYLEFWGKEISFSQLEMPRDFKLTNEVSNKGDVLHFKIEKDLYSKIKEDAKVLDVTLFSYLYSVFSILLSKYSRNEDITCGIPFSGRFIPESENVIGMFVNTLPCRTFPESAQKFSDYLKSVSDTVKKIKGNQNVYLDEILKGYDSQSLPFNTVFNLVNFHEERHGEISFKINECCSLNPIASAIFDLVFQIIRNRPEDKELNIFIEYRSTVYKEDTIKRMKNHFLRIIEQTINDRNILLREIALVTEQERLEILNKFNGASAVYPISKTVPKIFEEQVLKTPYNLALICQGREYSYKELSRITNFIGKKLRDFGLGTDEIVPISVGRNEYIVIGGLSVNKGGGAFTFVDPNLPFNRQEYIIKSSEASIVLVDVNQKGRFTNIEGVKHEFVFEELIDELVSVKEEVSIELVSKPEDLFSIITTSGSTGAPKGSMIEHRNFVNFAYYYNELTGTNSGDSVGSYAAFSFDVSVATNFAPLLCGATVCIVSEEIRLDISSLNQFFKTYNITVTFLPTPIGEYYIKEVNDSPLKTMAIGGDQLTSYWKRSYKIINAYAPSECTVAVIMGDIDENYKDRIPLGRVQPNNKVYIFDSGMNLCPVGVPGELYIGGIQVGRGYFKKEEITREKFIKLEGYGRLYRSGDLAKWTGDGQIIFLGRIDFQVKIRGFRIELGEIESKILEIPEVKDALVLAIDDTNGNKYLCSYYVSDKDIQLDYFKEVLVKDLPAYMIPDFFIRMESFPLTPNGKVDRKALPKPDFTEFQIEYIAPRNEIESTIAQAYSKVLGIERIGVKDNFFTLGGNSLKVVALVSKLNAKNFEIKFADVFKYKTVEEIAKYIKSGCKDYGKIKSVEKKEYYMASESQTGMYLTDKMGDLGTTYNIPVIIEIDGKLNREIFGFSLDKLLKRHEIFRTSFGVREGKVVQFVNAEQEISKEYAKINESSLKSIVDSFIKPFDLDKAPLLRVKLLKVSDDKHILLFDIHHIIFDGFSVDIFINELMAIYDDRKLEDVKLSYKDFSEWEKVFVQSETYARKRNYWMTTLSGELPLLELPLDFTRRKEWNYEGSNVSVNIDEKLNGKIKKFVSNSSGTSYMFLLAAYFVLLGKYSRQEDIIIGAAASGRVRDEVQNMIGMFVKVLPLRAHPNSGKKFISFLSEVMESVLGLLSNQDYSLANLASDLKVRPEIGRNPIYDVGFNFLEKNKVNFGNLSITLSMPELNTSKFDLHMDVLESNGTTTLTINYKTKLFKPETIHRMLGHYVRILEQIIDTPDIQLKNIDITTEQERLEILNKFNNTYTDYPRYKVLKDIIEESAAIRPTQDAVVCGDKKLTYQELNEKANKLAHKLIGMGVKPETKVGVLLGRRPEIILAFLAVLKAGGGYVPIDSSYPKDRIKFIIEDSEAIALISEKKLIELTEYHGAYIDIDSEESYSQVCTNPETVSKPENIACMIYTSGSTGAPKGTILENRNMVNCIHWYIEKRKLKPSENIAEHASFSFDGSIFGSYPVLAAGGTTYIIHNEIRLSLQDIDDFFYKNNIKGCFFTTQLAEQYNELFDNATLRFIDTGGEKLKKFTKRNYDLFNCYGPTESTVLVTDFLVDREDCSNIPIGSPIANVHLYIVDSNLNLCPVGVPGELCISGESLSRGYFKRDDVTKVKFVKNPFANKPGYERMYHTGDLVKWLPDGNIEFLGRIDFQVKIRGFRIELGEIESKILEIPEVKDALVLAIDDFNGNKFLCSYYVSDKDIQLDYFKELLGKDLPVYMIPDFFIRMESFPLTPNGKIDRKFLPKPDFTELQIEYIAPRNEIESTIAQAYSEVLGVEKIGVKDNFFSLGGSSLKAISVVAKLQIKKINIIVSNMFDYPTVEALASIVKTSEFDLHKKFESLKEGLRKQIRYSSSKEFQMLISKRQKEYDKKSEYFNFINLAEKKSIKNILLTGATGYLGSSILRELITSTDYHIFCIVRGKSKANSIERLNETVRYYFGASLEAELDKRVTVVSGSLSDPKLGLAEGDYENLSTEIDSIIHAAANVGHYGEYKTFYNDNVSPVINLSDFATSRKKKCLHYVSTRSVCDAASSDEHKFLVFDEDTAPSALPISTNVYVRTKLEGEIEAVKARAKGIDINIYRVGNLVFDSDTGRHQKNIQDNGFFQTVSAYLNIGYVPDIIDANEMSCVNLTAKAICRLFDRKNIRNQIFHVYNPNKIILSDVLTSGELGLNLQKVSFEDFMDILYENNNRMFYDKYIRNFMLHMGWLEESVPRTIIEVFNKRTNSILSKIGFTWGELKSEDFKTFIYNSFKDRIDVLKAISVFASISETTVSELCFKAKLGHAAIHERLMTEGKLSDSVYIILNGILVETKKSIGGWEGVIRIIPKGTVLGVESFIAETFDFISTKTISNDTIYLAIKKSELEKILAIDQKLLLNIIKSQVGDKDRLIRMITAMG